MKVEKTVLEWLDELPPNLKIVATAEIEPLRFSTKYKSLKEVMVYSFRWIKSPMGVEFWNRVLKAIDLNLSFEDIEQECIRHIELMNMNGNNVALAKQLLAEEEQENG
jgi:hypothetical protein